MPGKREPGLRRQPVQAFFDASPVGGRQHLITRPALGRDLRVQLEGHPFHVDVAGMDQAIAENRYGDYLDARRQEAEELMIDGIPAHVIADRYLVMGAQPYDVFERVMAKLGVARR